MSDLQEVQHALHRVTTSGRYPNRDFLVLTEAARKYVHANHEAGAKARFADEWDRLDWDVDTSPSQKKRLLREARITVNAALGIEEEGQR